MLNNEQIAKLEELGGNRWQVKDMDRLYFNCRDLGCEFEYYKTGSIRAAYHEGTRCSNSEGYRMKGAKSYIDVKTGEAHSTHDWLLDSLQKKLEEVLIV